MEKKWAGVDAVSEAQAEYMLQIGNEIEVGSPSTLFNLLSLYYTKNAGKYIQVKDLEKMISEVIAAQNELAMNKLLNDE